MAGITTAMTGSFKTELAQAIHNFTTTSGNVFKLALLKASETGTYDATTTNYSVVTGNSDEVAAGGGYTTGGFAWTAAQNITPAQTTSTAFWQFSIAASWTSATFGTTGAILYNSSASNKSVSLHDFGGLQSVSSGTFTLNMPTNNASSALLRIT